MKLLVNLLLAFALVAAACVPQYEPGEPGEILGAVADPDPMGARDIAATNGFAVATGSALDNAGQAWLKVVDIRDPRDPELLAELSSAGSIGDAVEFDGRYAYATVIRGSSLDFVVVDVFDPTRPQEVRRIPIPGQPTAAEGRGMEVVSGFAYVAATDSGFHVIDVHSPASAALVASRALPGTLPLDLEIIDGMATISGSLARVDVRSPTSPVVVLSGAATIYDVDGADGILFTQSGSYISARDPESLLTLGLVAGWAPRIEVDNGLIAARGGLAINFFDSSVPSNMQLIGDTVWTPGVVIQAP
jgi:hypothetical protein